MQPFLAACVPIAVCDDEHMYFKFMMFDDALLENCSKLAEVHIEVQPL